MTATTTMGGMPEADASGATSAGVEAGGMAVSSSDGTRGVRDGSFRSKARAVTAVFSAFAERTGAFSRATGLACAPGCGACCTYPHVEATPLEMLPAAIAILDEGRAVEWLDSLAASNRASAATVGAAGVRAAMGRSSPCSFFEPGEAVGGGSGGYARGRCGSYAVRPLVCRLFGSGVRRTATGEREILACRVLKERDGALLASMAARLRDEAFDAPEAGPAFDALFVIDPALATERLPIDRALERALLSVALEASYESDATMGRDVAGGAELESGTPLERPS